MILILMNVKAAVLLGAAFVVALSSCGIPHDDSLSGIDDESKIQVAAAFYPLQYATRSVGGDLVNVTSLTTPGVEPHDAELTPKQLAAAIQSDLVVYLSGFQPAVDEAVKQSDPAKVLDVAEFANLKSSDESLGEHDEDDDAPDHDHVDMDPHFWLDPVRLAAVEAAIADRLAELAPEKANIIMSSAQTSDDVLMTLDAELTTGLENCARRELFTSHDAFGYFTGRYGLEQVSVAGISPNIEPSPSRIAEVQRLARTYGATTIFFETAASNAVAKSIARDIGLTLAVLDPIETLSDQSAGADYPAIMRVNLSAIQEANDCD